MTPREKVLRDALQQVQNVWFTYWGRPIDVVVEALTAADAIPDAPVKYSEQEVWNKCVETFRGHFGHFCDNMKIGQSTALMPIPDAPVAQAILCECGNCGYCHERARTAATKPVPSRAELIELMRDVYLEDPQLPLHGVFTRVLDALIKAGAVR